MINLEITQMEQPNNLGFIQEVNAVNGQVLLFDKNFDERFTNDAKSKQGKNVFVYDKNPDDFIKNDRYKAYQLIGAKTPDGWVVGIEPVSENERLKPNCFGLIRVSYYQESEVNQKITRWEHQINSAMNNNQWRWSIHESFGMTFDEAFGFNSKEEALIDAMKRHDISQYRVFYNQEDITQSILGTVDQVRDGKQIDGPQIINDRGLDMLLIPYDVTFRYRGETVTRRLFNNTDADHVAQFYQYDSEIFCLRMNGEDTKVEVYELIEDGKPYELAETINAIEVKPVIENEAHFRVEDAWMADGKWKDRPSDEAIWQKAQEIYPDSFDLKATNPFEASNEIDRMIAECDQKFREAGATDEEIVLAPDYTAAAVIYIGQTGFGYNTNDFDGALLFYEGNLEVGHNVTVDFSGDYHNSFDKVKKELCEAFNVESIEEIDDIRTRWDLDAMQSHPVSWYVAPNETLGQAIKRHFTDEQTQDLTKRRGR